MLPYQILAYKERKLKSHTKAKNKYKINISFNLEW